MGKTYIVGHHKASGIKGDDSGHLGVYFELGWELGTTGFWVKCNATKDDTVISARDRLFMYKHLTDNLIAYEDYVVTGEEIDVFKRHEELLREYNDRVLTPHELSSLGRVKLRQFPSPKRDFICVQIRKRDWSSTRDGDTDTYKHAIEQLSQKYEVYVVGKSNDELNGLLNVRCVNLEEYCFLIGHSKCAMSLGPASGCMILNQLYGRSSLPVYIRVDGRQRPVGRLTPVEGHILYFDEKVNVANVDSFFFYDDDASMFREIFHRLL